MTLNTRFSFGLTSLRLYHLCLILIGFLIHCIKCLDKTLLQLLQMHYQEESFQTVKQHSRFEK